MKKVMWLFLLTVVPCGYAEVKLPGILSDHMVLQRDMDIHLWGWAAPGEMVTVSLSGREARTQTGADGKWRVDLKPLPAGGPYSLTVAGKTNTIIVKDILVGEVWVASGQSNMELPMGSCMNAPQEIAAANYPLIRQFLVPRIPQVAPAENVSGGWEVCSPKTVGGFTGVGYYFARYLHKELKVPVGIINSSWGGTPAEAWTPLAAMKAQKINPGVIKEYERCMADQDKLMKKFGEESAIYWKLKAEGKIRDRQQDPGNKGFGLGWAKADFNDKSWETVQLPAMMPEAMDGSMWYRKEIMIPADWAGKDLLVSLGIIDDFDMAYYNGVKIGSTGNETPGWWMHPRKYVIPGGMVKGGRSVLAIRVFDDYLEGGFKSTADKMFVMVKGSEAKISLAGPWRQKVEEKLSTSTVSGPPTPPYGPANPNTPGVLYNSMIYPLSPYGIRGAIWYQGESNAGNAKEYCKLLSTMISEWRNCWGQGDFPFGIVQLANFLAVQDDPNLASAWANLREAQLKTALTNDQVGLAVIVDIGDGSDIHPRNKQDVGKRLALWALAKAYGQKKVVYSGPLYKSMKIEGDKIRITFDHIGGGLVARGGNLTGFAVAGPDKKFVWATARIEGDHVVVWSDKVANPAAVRYAWADNPACNLYNKAGLPACPFRTDK